MRDIVERIRIAETAPLDADGKVSLFLVLNDARAEIARLAAERDAALRERDAAKEECERLGQIVSKHHETRQWDIEKIEGGCVRVCFGDHHRAADCEWEYFIQASREADLQNQRSGAIRERDEAKKECERLRAKIVAMEGQSRMETEAEIAVEEAWERCGIAPYWPDDEPGTSHRYAKSMEAEIVRLRACVAELESAAKLAPAANAGGYSNQATISGAGKSAESGKQEPTRYAVVVGGEMRNTVYEDFREAREKASEIACRGTPHIVGVVALYAAPQPPMVKVPHLDDLEADERPVWESACEAWITAIREAGGEVVE